MGKLEENAARKQKRGNLQRIVLRTVAAAGFISMAVVAPNALQALAKLGIIDMRKPRQKELINRARNRLVIAGLLARDKRNRLYLTAKGEAKLRQLELEEHGFNKPKTWDGKWRLLVFDIPENRRNTRAKVRNTLNAIGFKRMQDSVWIYPYDCEDLITLLKTDFKIGRDLIYCIAEAVENDSVLRKQFGLPPPL